MKPDPKLIDSMALRYRHDFSFLDETQKDSIRTTMTQLWEEVVGLGFYKAEKTPTPKPQVMSYENPNDAKHELPVVFFLGIKVIRYRIVRDRYCGFECQKWRLWFPFWLVMDFANTHMSIDAAISYIKNDGTVVISS